jgi:hypothetical protein
MDFFGSAPGSLLMAMDAYRLKRALRQFRRTKTYQKYLYPGKSPLLISDACKFLLDNCDSSFLFDLILKSQELKILRDVPFQVWMLHQLRNDMSWIITCSSSSVKKPLFIHSIPFTSFPLQEITIWVIQKAAILPQER